MIFNYSIGVEEFVDSVVICEGCNKEFTTVTLLKHISHKPSCKTFYGARFEQMKQREHDRRHTKEKRRTWKQKSREKLGTKKELENKRKSYEKQKKDSDANLKKFYQETEFGPEFICVCCHAMLDENQTLELTDERKRRIGKALLKDCCEIRNDFYDPRGNGRFFICKYCYEKMAKEKKMPNRSIKNGLTVEELPPDLADITGLENSLIAKYLLFLKMILSYSANLKNITAY